jgi:hypothetical protein
LIIDPLFVYSSWKFGRYTSKVRMKRFRDKVFSVALQMEDRNQVLLVARALLDKGEKKRRYS